MDRLCDTEGWRNDGYCICCVALDGRVSRRGSNGARGVAWACDSQRLDSKTAAHWKQAQQWLRTVKRAADVGPAAITPPFPLNGEQLRSLQRAVDRAAQTGATQKARSKGQRIVNKARNHAPVSVYVRLRQGLKLLRLSSGALATFLAAMCVLSLRGGISSR